VENELKADVKAFCSLFFTGFESRKFNTLNDLEDISRLFQFPFFHTDNFRLAFGMT
jgi:hypothetical protein